MAKATETAMEKGAGELLENTIKQTSGAAGKEVAQEVIKDVAKQVASDVAAEVSEQIAKNIAEQTTRFLGQGHLLEAFSKQAIEQMVARAVETVAEKALKTGAETTAKELTQAVVKEVQREVVKAAIHASLMSAANTAKAVTRASLQGANGVFQGEIAKERAELQKVVQQLMAESNFMQFMLDEFEKLKKRAKEDIGNLMDGAGKALAAGSEAQNKTGAVLSSIAANIA
jgi:secreted effector protein SseC